MSAANAPTATKSLTIKKEKKKALGAIVSEEVDSREYTWSEDGRLVGIAWHGKELQGELSFHFFTKLCSLDCSGNIALTSFECGGDNELMNLEAKIRVKCFSVAQGTDVVSVRVS